MAPFEIMLPISQFRPWKPRRLDSQPMTTSSKKPLNTWPARVCWVRRNTLYSKKAMIRMSIKSVSWMRLNRFQKKVSMLNDICLIGLLPFSILF